MKFVVDLHNLTWRGWWTERESKGDFSTPSILMAFRTVLLDHFETNKLVLNIKYLKTEGVAFFTCLIIKNSPSIHETSSVCLLGVGGNGSILISDESLHVQ